MPSLLSSAIALPARNQQLLVFQSSSSQSCLPILRDIVQKAVERARETTVLFCLLYPPSSFLDSRAARTQTDNISVVDRTMHVPDYVDDIGDDESATSLTDAILDKVRSVPTGPLNVVIDSVDTLLSDLGSYPEPRESCPNFSLLFAARGGTSRLILHVLASSTILPILTQTHLSPSLTHVIAHPTALLTHLSSAYLTPPPPLSAPEKFWGIFIPISERHWESEKLVFGTGGEGGGLQEFVAEVIVRGGADGSGRRRGLERTLEGWSPSLGGPCELRELEVLKPLWTNKPTTDVQDAPDPTQNLSFNLNLTPQQQRARAQVPLPYAHEGKTSEQTPNFAAILYDPDSADDIDDDDPDEDLDI